MRCYFMKAGRISAVHIFEPRPPSDGEAVKASKKLFREQVEPFEGFELWDRARKVYEHGARADGEAKRS
jgi:hypothetical protein